MHKAKISHKNTADINDIHYVDKDKSSRKAKNFLKKINKGNNSLSI